MDRRRSLQSIGIMAMGAIAGTRPAVAQTKEAGPAKESLDFVWTTFRNRRSVRKFKPDPIPDEQITVMLDMAKTAPTSGNQQPWKFLVMRDAKSIAALRDGHIKRRVDMLT